MKFSKLAKRLCSGVLAGMLALSVMVASFSTAAPQIEASAASSSITNDVIKQACKMLGTKYVYGGASTSGSDCSGMVYWTLKNLGLSSSGYGSNNPVPRTTSDWLSGASTSKTYYWTYNGKTTPVKSCTKYKVPTPEKNKSTGKPYWEKADGSTIAPGSIVIGSDGDDGEDHMWIYLGDYSDRVKNGDYGYAAVIDDLVNKWGVSESTAKKYVADNRNNSYKNDGGTHWRIECTTSNYLNNNFEGVMIDNGTDGKIGHSWMITTHEIPPEPLFGTAKLTKRLYDGESGDEITGSDKQSYSTKLENGSYKFVSSQTTDSDGKAVFTTTSTSLSSKYNSYYIHELHAPDGFTLDTNYYKVNFVNWQLSNGNTPFFSNTETYHIASYKYDINATLSNTPEDTPPPQPQPVSFSKQDIEGNELPGAEIKLLDSNGNEVDSWTSGSEPYVIYDLAAGSYTMHEEIPADGYILATDISFSIDENGEIVNCDTLVTYDSDIPIITMVDDYTRVSLSKQDIEGSELPGAEMQLLDSNGNEVDSWTSGEEPHMIEGLLKVGEKYTMHEEISPDGYLVATDITFSIDQNGNVISEDTEVTVNGYGVGVVTMVDAHSQFSVAKVDENGTALSGAVLALFDADGNEIERWTTDGSPKVFKGLSYGRYTVKELKSPNGFNTAKDITFEHTADNDMAVYTVVNYRGFVMPQTGGGGTAGLMSAGAVMLLIGLVYGIYRSVKKRKADEF